MKQLFINALFITVTTISFGQITFKLDVAGEGNFGTPNGDVFRRNTTTIPATTVSGVYQQTNGGAGFDVFQDFVILGNKALIAEKPAGAGRVVITSYPSMAEIHTFTTSNAPQTLAFASPTKAYVSMGNPGSLQLIDLVNNTMTAVSDPNGEVGGSSNHLVHVNGIVYVQMGNEILKVDTLTNTVTGSIAPNIGDIEGLVYEEQSGLLWILTASGQLASIDIANNDAIGATIATGISGTNLLRSYDGNLYFWSLGTKELFQYSPALWQPLPLTSIYTSTLPGASWAFGYGRSFDIDQNYGHFVLCSADNFIAPAPYEVVNLNTLTVIESGTLAGCASPNRCYLKTFPAPTANPVPDQSSLSTINAECSATVTAPTADGGAVTATTNDPVVYTAQGTYTVTWTYTNSIGSVTQTQSVIIDDVTPPVADIPTLSAMTLACNATITDLPTATDNCENPVTVSTNDPLSYNTTGTYTVTWIYTDAAGNTSSQDQEIIVDCSIGIDELNDDKINVYPNPANDYVVTIDFGKTVSASQIKLYNLAGKEYLSATTENSDHCTINISTVPSGSYLVSIANDNNQPIVKRITIVK